LCILFFFFFFFFSSRRRHTRYIGDWSSDVCSSDLAQRIHRRGSLAAARRLYAGPCRLERRGREDDARARAAAQFRQQLLDDAGRSEERRVGKEGRWGGGTYG